MYLPLFSVVAFSPDFLSRYNQSIESAKIQRPFTELEILTA